MNPQLFRILGLGSKVTGTNGLEGRFSSRTFMVEYGDQGVFGPFRDVEWEDGCSTSIEAKDLAGGKGICP